MKPLRLVSASDAAWTPISELKGTKSYTVNTESDSWMEGRDLIAIKVISEDGKGMGEVRGHCG